MQDFGEELKALTFDEGTDEKLEETASSGQELDALPSDDSKKVAPPKQDEYLWAWKVRILASQAVHCIIHDVVLAGVRDHKTHILLVVGQLILLYLYTPKVS